jgi:hypothetical protein
VVGVPAKIVGTTKGGLNSCAMLFIGESPEMCRRLTVTEAGIHKVIEAATPRCEIARPIGASEVGFRLSNAHFSSRPRHHGALVVSPPSPRLWPFRSRVQTDSSNSVKRSRSHRACGGWFHSIATFGSANSPTSFSAHDVADCFRLTRPTRGRMDSSTMRRASAGRGQ